jgi:hypothetical protein
MILVGRDKRFELKILSHEFPGSGSYHDRNWLNVSISVQDGDLSWSAEDSCLLSYELVRLRDWVANLFHNEKSEIFFTENELGFLFDKRNSELTIILDFNFHPKGRNYQYGEGGDDEHLLSFKMDERKLKALLSDIDGWISKFPVKG